MILQDPFASLDPRMRVEEIIGEAPRVHGVVARRDVADYVAETMIRVALDPTFRPRYPHQFSGGQRQRLGIARARRWKDPTSEFQSLRRSSNAFFALKKKKEIEKHTHESHSNQ